MAAASAPGTAEVHTLTWRALGTSVLVCHTGPPTTAIGDAVRRELDAIDAAASRFRDDSELSRLTATPAPTPTATATAGARVPISPLLHEAIALGLRAAALTGGAVDPTLGAELVALGYDRDHSRLDAVDATAPLTPADRIVVTRTRRRRWPEIELADHPPAVRLPPGVSLDLGATAKALAADRAAAAAAAAVAAATSPRGVLVSLGGDIATAGAAPAGGWPIHVTDDHRATPDAPGQTITIRSGGLATSSLTTRRWRHDGQTRHHILDPDTGHGVRPVWRTVSVAAASCADANIAATAAIVLGQAGERWLAGQGVPARLVAADGAVTRLSGWPR